jgi:hypothetical protein
MNRSEIRELMGRLEALEALAKLFNNLWFDRIRQDIEDPKVQAYLTVFDDAFPNMNHVIEFVRRSAGMLSGGEASQEQWQRMESEFDYLHRLLKAQAEDVDSPTASLAATEPEGDLSQRERQALESLEQSDIDSLFEEEEEYELEEEEDAPSIAGEMIDEGEDLDESEALEVAALLESDNLGEEAGDAEEDVAAASSVEHELEELLEGVDEDELSDEDEEQDLEDLLGDTAEEETEEDEQDVDLESLLEEESAEPSDGAADEVVSDNGRDTEDNGRDTEIDALFG